MEQLEEALMRRAKEEDRRESVPLVAEVKVRENTVMMSNEYEDDNDGDVCLFNKEGVFFLELSPKQGE